MQRARLLRAAVPVVDELGWSGVTVGEITMRARVSRRTFYDLFANHEDCLLAMLSDARGRIERDLVAANLDRSSWVERVRTGLWMILCALDRDPVLARVCVVQSACGTRRVLEAREVLLARAASVIDSGARESARAAQVPSLVAEGLVGATLAILYKRLLQREQAPLGGLHGELMGMIVLPYLGSARASKERSRPAPRPSHQHSATPPQHVAGMSQDDALRGVPMRLTYRTARVLDATAQTPGASNRIIGEHAGIHDQGQVSKLLARLQRLGLLSNTGVGQTKGEQNAWRLTTLGERITEQLTLNTNLQEEPA